jgi:hypothetical protein
VTAIGATTCSKAFVVTLHGGFFTVVVIYSAAMALWGIVLYLRGSNPSGSYLGSLVIAEGVALFQVIVGGIVFLTGHRPDEFLHYVYGLVAALALPFAYSFSARGTERRDSLVFALAALFLIGIAVRAAATGCNS